MFEWSYFFNCADETILPKISSTFSLSMKYVFHTFSNIIFQYFSFNSFKIIYFPLSMTKPFTITLCVKLCLNSVKKELLSMIYDKDDCIDLPTERSDSCEMNLMIVNWIYDSLFNNVNSFVYVNAIGGDFVLCSRPSKYLPAFILCSSFSLYNAK